jgi:hypothetical protein
MIIIPEWKYLQPEFKTELITYVEQGGKLVVIGPDAVQLFEKELGIQITGKPEVRHSQYLSFGNTMAAMTGLTLPVTLPSNSTPFGNVFLNDDFRDVSTPAASISAYGKGKIAAVYLNLGENYVLNKSPLERDFINKLTSTLFEKPMVKVEGSHLVHVALNKLKNTTIVHLINIGGPHTDKNIYAYDEVPTIGPLTITIDQPKPKSVVLQPDNKPLPYSYKNGKIVISLPGLDIHRMIAIE